MHHPSHLQGGGGVRFPFFLIGILVLTSLSECLAQRLLYGTVMDAATGEGISDALLIAGRSSVSTDTRGFYRLRLPMGQQELRCSRVGYESLTIEIGATERDSDRVDIHLVPTLILLGELPVTGERPPLSTIHGLGGVALSVTKTEDLSGPFSDLLRTVQAVTGVASNNETSSRFSVRGGASNENLLQLNGTTLLEPFHLKESENTSLSVVRADLLKQVLFIPGGFPARYGDRLSSVVDMEYREGRSDRFAATAGVSLVALDLTVEGPIGGATTALISTRTTYSSYVQKYFSDANDRRPSFYDVQGVLGGDPVAGVHTSGLIILSRDATSGFANGKYGTTLIQLQGSLSLSEKAILRALLSTYNDSQHLSWSIPRELENMSILATDFSVTLQEAALKLETDPGDAYSLISGLEFRREAQDLRQRESSLTGPAQVWLEAAPTLGSFYVENLFKPFPGLLFNAGFRVDRSTFPDEVRFSPRILAAYRLSSGVTLKGAWGVYCQTANGQQHLAAVRAGLPPQKMQRSVHTLVGLELPLRKDLAFRVDLFHKAEEDLISYQRLANGEIVHTPRNDSEGKIDGIDLEASFSDQRVFGWVSAAFLVAKELNHFDNLGWRFRPNDQAKTVTLVFEYHFNEHLTANIRALYGSGFAYGVDTPSVSITGLGDARMHYPDYKRADLKLQYSGMIDGLRGMITLDIMNVFGFRNVQSFAGPGQLLGFNLLLPMVIDLGIRVWV
jgi:hypothetical protein